MTMIDTPDGIAFARLASLKGALSLQTKGLRMSRHFSATKIGKEQYMLTGQAAAQHQRVASIIDDHFKVREYESAEDAGNVFGLVLNAIVDRGGKITESSINGQIARENLEDPEFVKVIEAIGRIYLFEVPQSEAVRVLFR